MKLLLVIDPKYEVKITSESESDFFGIPKNMPWLNYLSYSSAIFDAAGQPSGRSCTSSDLCPINPSPD